MSSRLSSARQSAAVAQQQGDDVDVCKAGSEAPAPSCDSHKSLPSYARPTTSSKRRASVVSSSSGRLSSAGGSVTRPQSAEATTRNSIQPSKQAPLTAQPSFRTDSRKSIIAADSALRLSNHRTSRSSCLNQQACDSNAASDQHLQQASNPGRSLTESSSRGSRRSSSSDTQAHTGKRPTSASSGETTVTSTTSRIKSHRQTTARLLVKKQQASTIAAAAAAAYAVNGAKDAGSYAKQQHKQTTPRLAASAKVTKDWQTAAKAVPTSATTAAGQSRSTGRAIRAMAKPRHSASSAYMPFPTAGSSQTAEKDVHISHSSSSVLVQADKRKRRDSSGTGAPVRTGVRPLRSSTSSQPASARTPPAATAQSAAIVAAATPNASKAGNASRPLPAAIAAKPKATSRTPRSSGKAAAIAGSQYASESSKKTPATVHAVAQDGVTTPHNSKGDKCATTSGVGATIDGPTGKFTMLVTPGGPQWPAAGLVPYSITPEAKTAARTSSATSEQQQQEKCHLVPYSVTPISRTAAKASLMTSQQQQQQQEANSNGMRAVSRNKASSSKQTPASSSRQASQGYAAASATARRRAAAESLSANGTVASARISPVTTAVSADRSTPVSAAGCDDPVDSSPAAALLTSASVVPLEILSSGMSGLSIGEMETDAADADANLAEARPASPAAASPAAELDEDVSSDQLAAADEETAAAAAISAAYAAAAEAKAAAEALERELAHEAARLAADAAAQVQQQQLAREAAAAAATLAAAAAAEQTTPPHAEEARLSMSPAAAYGCPNASAAAAGSSVGGSSSAYPRRPMRTPEASPMRSRTPGRSPVSAAQHAELAAKMQDLELSWGNYKVTRDASPNVRSSIRNSTSWQQQQGGRPDSRSSSRLSSDADTASVPSKFWDLSPPSAVATTANGRQTSRVHNNTPASNASAAATPTPAAAISKPSAGTVSAASAAKSAGLEVQLQELRDIWGKYNSSREASPRASKSPCVRSSWANSAEIPVTATAGAAAAQHKEGFDGNTTGNPRVSEVSRATANKQQQQQRMTPASVSSKQAQTGGNGSKVAAAAAGVKRRLESGAVVPAVGSMVTAGARRISAGRPRRCSITRAAAPLVAAAPATRPRVVSTTTTSSSSNSSRRQSKGSAAKNKSSITSGAAAVGAFGAVVPRSPSPAAAAAVTMAADAGEETSGRDWDAAAVWCAPSPDPCSPQRRIQRQGLQQKTAKPNTGLHSPAAALASAATAVVSTSGDVSFTKVAPSSVVASSKAAVAATAASDHCNPATSPFSTGRGAAAAAATLNSPTAASPKLAVPPNSPAVTPGADIDQVAARLSAWSAATDTTLYDSNVAAAADSPDASLAAAAAAARGGSGLPSRVRTAAKSVTTAAGSATLCWMLPSTSPGTVEGKHNPPAAAAVGDSQADPMQASWLAFTAAAAPVADEAAGSVTVPRFRLSGIGTAAGTPSVSAAVDGPYGSPSVTFKVQPAAAHDITQSAVSIDSSGEKSKSMRRAGCSNATPAASPAGQTPQQQQKQTAQTTAAANVGLSPAVSNDVFYTPMQFTPGSSTSKKKGRSSNSTRKTPGKASTSGSAAPRTAAATATPAAELFYTPADGLTPGLNRTAASSMDFTAAAPEAADSPVTGSSSKRQKSSDPGAAAASSSSAAVLHEVRVSRQLLGLFDAAEGVDEDASAAAAVEELSRKYSTIQGPPQTPPTAAAVVASASPVHIAYQQQPATSGSSISGRVSIPQTPASTPISFKGSTPAAAAGSNGEDAAAFLAAITPLMRSMGGYGSLSSRKLPHIGSGARRLRLPAAEQEEVLPAAAAAGVEGEPYVQSAVRRSARLAARTATATPQRQQPAAQPAAAAAVAELGSHAVVAGTDMKVVTLSEPDAASPSTHSYLQELQPTPAGVCAAAGTDAGVSMAYSPDAGDDASAAQSAGLLTAEMSLWEDAEDDEFVDGAEFIDSGSFNQPGGEPELSADEVKLVLDESYVTTRRRR